MFEGSRGNPGPGTYQCRELVGFEGVKSTMIPRRPNSAPAAGRSAPGPGAYNAIKEAKNGPAYKYTQFLFS